MQPIQPFYAVNLQNGAVLPGASVSVMVSGSNTPAALFDLNGNSILNPTAADGTGKVSFQTAAMAVDMVIQSGGLTLPPLLGVTVNEAALSGFNVRGVFTAGSTYAVGDIAWDPAASPPGAPYKCIVAVSDATTAPHSDAAHFVAFKLADINGPNSFKNVQAVATCNGTIAGAVSVNLAAFASSTGVTPASNQPVASNTLVLTATANVTSLAFTNPVDGAIYNIYLCENGTGGYSWPSMPASFNFGASGAPTLTTTPNAVNLISVQYIAALAQYRSVGSAG